MGVWNYEKEFILILNDKTFDSEKIPFLNVMGIE